MGSGSDSGRGDVGRPDGGAGESLGGGTSPGPTTGPTTEPIQLIGDGSTADTGKQPHQPDAPVPLAPGQAPPQ
ncbi:hypothetical protein ACIQMR_27870, partial [Streptomyces sp. NPDC091376]